MKTKSLKFKLTSLILFAFTPIIIGLFAYVFPTYKEFFLTQKKLEIKTAVEVFMGKLEIISEEEDKGILTREEAYARARSVFNKARYNGTDYFFAFGIDGAVLAHGLVPDYTGQDWLEKEDSAKVKFVKNFIETAKSKDGAGFVPYKFIRKKGQPAEDKISYVKLFPKWGWIVGTGVYLSSVQEQINSTQNKIITGVVIVIVLAFIGGIIFSINLSKRLESIVGLLKGETKQVEKTSLDVLSISESLSSSSFEQASALQETSASVLETSKMIERNSENAHKSIEISEKSRTTVDVGRDSLNRVVQAINEIATSNESIINQIEQSNKEISNIVTVISEIGEKTKVINDIVFQTKLLSFNASVEAARSGEHGKGFAVVAEEVGKLAEISGDSAKEITEMLDDSIAKVEEQAEKSKERIDNLVKQASEKVNEGVQVAKECLSIFNDIVGDSSEISTMIDEISSASSEQSEAVKEITTAISELDEAAKDNSLMSQNTAQTADNLKKQVQSLQEVAQKLDQAING